MRTELIQRLKLAAVDLDGTLLGPDGQISPANLGAVTRLQDAGVQVVLASGRHYNSMHKYASALPGVQWLVSCQGGELADVHRRSVLQRVFLPEADVRKTLELGRSFGFSTTAYSVDGVFTAFEKNDDLEFYADLAGIPPRQVQAKELLEQPIFKIIWIGDSVEIDEVGAQLVNVTKTIQPIRTHKRMWEFMPAEVSKASALRILSARLGIESEGVAAFGDGDNDVSMFAWAGVSVAMPHGWPAAIREAGYTAPEGPADTAFARGVDLLFKKDRSHKQQEVSVLAPGCC